MKKIAIFLRKDSMNAEKLVEICHEQILIKMKFFQKICFFPQNLKFFCRTAGGANRHNLGNFDFFK